MLGRICEEFHCTPDVAVDLPYGLCLRIMQLRGYANTREYIETVPKDKLKQTAMVEVVLRTQAELAIEEKKAQLEQLNAS